MHTKNSSASNEVVESSLAPDHSTPDKDTAGENNSPPTVSKKEDDTGGGKIFQPFTNSEIICLNLLDIYNTLIFQIFLI